MGPTVQSGETKNITSSHKVGGKIGIFVEHTCIQEYDKNILVGYWY